MRKSLKSLFIKTVPAFALALFLFSCQKNDADIPPLPPAQQDSVLLFAYVVIDTTTAHQDTTSKYVFYYDNLKRNTRIDYFEYHQGVISEYQYKSVFSYEGTDTLPSKHINISLNRDQSNYTYISDTSYYKYTSGNLTYDSFMVHSYITGNRAGVARYSYDANKIGVIRPANNPGETDTISYTYQFKSNGNVVKQFQAVDSLHLTSSDTLIYTYDTHPNPFYRTQLKLMFNPKYPFFVYDTRNYGINGVNNLTESIVPNIPYSSAHNLIYKYQYKGNGYPLSVISGIGSPLSYSTEKAFFIYSN